MYRLAGMIAAFVFLLGAVSSPVAAEYKTLTVFAAAVVFAVGCSGAVKHRNEDFIPSEETCQSALDAYLRAWSQGNTAQDVLKNQDIIQAKEAMEAAQQQVNYYRAQLNKTFIRSPISGTVLQSILIPARVSALVDGWIKVGMNY